MNKKKKCNDLRKKMINQLLPSLLGRGRGRGEKIYKYEIY